MINVYPFKMYSEIYAPRCVHTNGSLASESLKQATGRYGPCSCMAMMVHAYIYGEPSSQYFTCA